MARLLADNLNHLLASLQMLSASGFVVESFCFIIQYKQLLHVFERKSMKRKMAQRNWRVQTQRHLPLLAQAKYL